MKWGKIFLPFAVWLVLSSGMAQDASLLDRLPDPDLLEGWHLARIPAIYHGEELFDLINGGADLFFEYGFISVVNTQYSDTSGSKIQLEIYEMDSDSSAYGIFSSVYGYSDVNRSIGMFSVVNHHYIAFVKGRYYVNVAWILKKDSRQESLEKLALIVESNIAENGKVPALVQKLEQGNYTGIPIYFLGNIALSNIYYFDYKDHFRIQQGVAFKTSQFLKVIFAYGDEVASQNVFTDLHAFLKESKRFMDPAMLYQGYTCSDNKGNKLIFRLGKGFITVVVAPGKESELMSEQEIFYHQVDKALNR